VRRLSADVGGSGQDAFSSIIVEPALSGAGLIAERNNAMSPTHHYSALRLFGLAGLFAALLSAPVALAAGAPAPSPAYTLPIHAVVVSDGTYKASITAAEIQKWVDYANGVYDEAGVQFSFDKTVDMSQLTNANLSGVIGDGDSNWAQVVADGNAEAAKHPGKVVVFFRYGPIDPVPAKIGPTGGGFSDDSYNFIVMPGFPVTTVCGHQNIMVFAHEAGHYLGLAHTFAVDFDTQADAKKYFDSNGKKPSLFDGDGLADTDPDPFSRENIVQCIAATTSVTISGVNFPLPRTNIMSYYDNVDDLTGDQIAIVRQTIQDNVHNLFPSDPAIAAAAEQPVNTSLYKNFDSPDIWLDAAQNGWAKYPSWQTLDAGGAPSGQGDALWVDHVNRIHYRVRNLGPMAAPDVRIQISLVQPIAFYTACGGISSGKETIISTEAIGGLEPGQVYHDFVEWTPSSSQPVLVKVKILATPHELSLANNNAKQTLGTLYFPPGSLSLGGLANQTFQIAIGNPCDWLADLRVLIVQKPPKWKVTVEPSTFVLPPGAEETLQVRLELPASARAGELDGVTLGFFAQSGDHMQPLGEITLTGHVARPTMLTCTPPRTPTVVGGAMILTGLLEPSPGSRSLALEYLAPDGSQLLRTVRTNAGGAYSDRFIPDQTGAWSVQAYWEGDLMYQPAMSTPCAFEVGGSSTQQVTFSPGVSTHELWYRGASCGPQQIELSVQLTGAPSPSSVVLFYRLRAGGDTTPWNDGVAMSPSGAGRYRLTLASQSIPGVVGFGQAMFQYQFVATGAGGAVVARSPVYGDVEVKLCSR
jgi:hypothetical protein